ncbi:hypothetical protein J2127_001081 [Methanococcus voltae]|nr:hypothetical protein [Methanococcus voltae]
MVVLIEKMKVIIPKKNLRNLGSCNIAVKIVVNIINVTVISSVYIFRSTLSSG